MKRAISMMFTEIFRYINGNDLKEVLGQNLSEYISGTYSMVIKLQNEVIVPVALALLSIFILLEFQKISMKVEGAGGAPTLGFEMIIKALIKFVMCYIVIVKIQLILDGIITVTGTMTRRIIEVGNSESLVNLYAQIEESVSKLTWWEQLIALLVVSITTLAALVVRVLVQITIYIRFLELYVFCAMAPIPMGALPNQEFSAMAKGFFKNFAATGLQSCFIALVLVIYPLIFSQILKNSGNDIWGLILGITVYMIALLFSINKTKAWAKMIVSAN